MHAMFPLLAALLMPGAPTAPILDGAWFGSAQIGGETLMMMMQLETKDGALSGVVMLPMENAEVAGSPVLEGSHLQFSGEGPSGPVVLDGDVDRRSFAGTIRRGDAPGTFALHRSMSPDEIAAFAGFYRDGMRSFVHLQRWDELGGQMVMLNEAGELRALFALDDSTFITGPGAMRTRPVESTLTFTRDRGGEAVSLHVARDNATRTFARTRAWEGRDLQFQNGDVTLAGTLFVPAGKGPHPAVVLTHGSGDQDRSAGLLFMVPLLDKGIAVLSYDKRGVGGSTGSWMNSGFDDLAADALAAVELLEATPSIDPKHIGIWGLSQGGWVGPLAASRSKDIAFVIAVSGPAVTPEVQELTRMRYEMIADGEPAEDVELAQDLYRALNHWVRTGQGWDEYAALREKAVGKRWGPPAGPPKKDNPYYTFWRRILDYDPLPVLRSVKCPVLAIYGGLDPNVRAVDNAPLMEGALRQAGNRHSKVIVYPAGDHVMLEAQTWSPHEMPTRKRFVPGYFDAVTEWTLERVGRGR